VKKLSLSEWASVAEVFGAVAVVVTLIYVGLEVNDSARAVRSASATDMASQAHDWYLEVAMDPAARALMLKGQNDPDSLTPEERLGFMYMIHAFAVVVQNSWYLAQEGTLDEELEQTLTNTIANVRELPGFLAFWESRQNLFKPAFREFMDDVIESGETNEESAEVYDFGEQ